MATRYVEQARGRLSGAYDQQEQSLQQQIPAIQQLYQTLSQNLGSQAERQIETGTQDILEDASSRGVLRSTLPVDAQTDLRSEIGSALAQSQGELGLEQATTVGDIRGRIGEVGVERQSAIQTLAQTLEEREYERKQNELDRQLEREQLAAEQASAASGGGGGAAEQEEFPEGYEMERKEDGMGFNFRGPGGRPMSMVDYAEATGTDLKSILRQGTDYDKSALAFMEDLENQGWGPAAIETSLRGQYPALF